MRVASFALVLSLIALSCPMVAQTRGSAGSTSSASSTGSVSAGPSRTFSAASSSVSNSGASTSAPIPGRRSFIGVPLGQGNRNHNRDFGRDFGNRHRRNLFGYPYGYGYGVDYGGWYTQQNEAQDRESIAQSERLEQSYQDDQKRQRELERQLADQRAADAAERDTRYAPAATTPASSDRDVPPTVLVYKDRHQVEIRNYAVSGSTIYEFNPHWTRKIPLSDLDIPATIAANNERGIEFNVPNSSPVKPGTPQQQQ